MISGSIDLAPDYAGKTICSLVAEAAKSHPNKLMVDLDGECISHAEMFADAEGVARALIARGIQRGAHVGIMLPNSIDYLRLFFGIMMAGCVPVTINSRYRGDELLYALNHAEIKALFISAMPETDYLSMLMRHAPDLDAHTLEQESQHLPHLKFLVVVERPAHPDIGMAAFLAEQTAASLPQIEEEDYAVMMFTSGTTSAPKACLLTHRSIIGNGMNMVSRWQMTEDDRFYDPLPFFHMSTILPLVGCLLARSEIYLTRHFNPNTTLGVLKRVKMTIGFFTFPTITNEVIYHPDFDPADVQTIRIINNVAPLSTLLEYEEIFSNAKGVSAYGLTEAGGVATFSNPREAQEKRLQTCGQPFPGIEMRIADAEDPMRILNANEKGEIQIRGYCLFSGYYKDELATQNTMTADGWLRTGDHGYLCAEGYVHFEGRLKDMLKVGGENVAAAEIESVLNTHPAVEMAQIVAAPDARLQEVAAAFVHLHDDMMASEEELIAFCRDKMASYKVPRYVRFVKEWPMSGTKVQKFDLRARIAAELEGAD